MVRADNSELLVQLSKEWLFFAAKPSTKMFGHKTISICIPYSHNKNSSLPPILKMAITLSILNEFERAATHFTRKEAFFKKMYRNKRVLVQTKSMGFMQSSKK